MHIVIDCRSVHSQMGGIGRAAWDLSCEIAKNRREHRISVLQGLRTPENFSIPGVEAISVDAAMIDEPFEQLELPVLLQNLGADLYLNPTFSIPAIRTTRRQVAVIHDVVFEDHPEWVEPPLRSYLKRWSRLSAASADHVITVSDHAAGRIREVYGVEESRVTRVYNGVAPQCFQAPTEGELERVRKKFDLGLPFILYMGSIEPKKGIPELVRAFANLRGEGFEGSLILAGGQGGCPLDLGQLLSGLRHDVRIRHLGYVEEVDKKPLLASSALFVYPSLYEGFGLPPLEAMALGVPCLVSSETSLPEVTGDVPLSVDVRDLPSFVQALKRALGDTAFRERSRWAGPARAHMFSWEDSAEQVLDLCEALGAA